MIILERLDLNKSLVLLFALLLTSCLSKPYNYLHRKNVSSEIICPDGKRFMIRFAYASEVTNAIQKDYQRKMRDKSSEDYTVIRVSNIESFHIHKMPPEELIKCRVEDRLITNIYPKYIRRFSK